MHDHHLAWPRLGISVLMLYYISVTAQDEVLVSDGGNHRIQAFSKEGQYLGHWGSYGSGDGQFNTPYGVCVTSVGEVVVCDCSNHQIQIFQ